jgi:hypothetical protein
MEGKGGLKRKGIEYNRKATPKGGGVSVEVLNGLG